MVGTTVALAICSAAVACVAGGPRRHQDGKGPLGVASSSSETIVAYPVDDQGRPSGGPWSFGGTDLCLETAGGEAVITDVAPRSTTGAAVEHVGSVVRNRYEGQGALRSLSGFPPSPATRFRPALGEVITTPCAANPAEQRGQLELVVGLAHEGEGGGWTGVSISYTHGGEQYVLDLDTQLIVCGRDPALAQACSKYYLEVD
jgi:hypothetical protein